MSIRYVPISLSSAVSGHSGYVLPKVLNGGSQPAKYAERLQTAVDDSTKDYLRSSYTLNATRRRLLNAGDNEHALVVRRFQNIADRPYVFTSGAAAGCRSGTHAAYAVPIRKAG